MLALSFDIPAFSRWLVESITRIIVRGSQLRVTPDTIIVQSGSTTVLAIPRAPEQRLFVRERESRARSAVRLAAQFGLTTAAIVQLTNASYRSRAQATTGVILGGLTLCAFLPSYRWRRVTQ